MRRYLAMIALGALLAAGCTDGGSISPLRLVRPLSPRLDDGRFTDDQIRDAVYGGTRFPAGFYRETGPVGYYVNTVSIRSPAARGNEWRELSTDDPATAWAWAESTAAYSDGINPLAKGPPNVTQRYFEFLLAPASGPALISIRVHRLSYLDRSMFDRMHPSPTLGVLKVRPIDATVARQAAEYLWYEEWREVRGYGVLSSTGFDDGTRRIHVIYDVESTFGDFGMCDDLRLNRLEYVVDRGSGVIQLRKTIVRHVTGHCN